MNIQEVKESPTIANINRLMLVNPLNDELDKNTRLKLKINNLLWEELPNHTTISQAEAMACEFFRIITNDTYED